MKWNKLFTLVSVSIFAFPFVLLANPEGAQIEAGSAIISAQKTGEKLNQELTITQASEKAIINWDKFSIQKGETTEFVLPSSNSSTLNRVTGGSLSEIYGTLKSNGDLLLINPQGVMIGPNGLVDVGGFIASTYNLKNEDFLKTQNLDFFGKRDDLDLAVNASIINQGQIIARSGDIILLAQDIDNQGLIQALQGETYLKAGCEVTLLPNEENKVKVRLKRKGSVRNSGTIKAIKAELEACGGIPECLAVSNEGVIEALGIGEKDGKLVLLSDEAISVSGTLIAKNEFSNTSETKGGTIHLLGDEVRLEEGSFINASGDLGGGEVLIGGDFQGNNLDIKNASYVYMDKEAVIHADALENGDGGKVILWSEKGTDWRGLATAKGGAESGDGGFVEVSSHGFLNPKGRFDALALASTGKNGELLLDPSDITITAAASAPAWANPYNPGPGEANPCNVDVADLIGAAGLGGGNVTISTSNGNQGSGDITVSTAVTSASGNNLTLTANRHITLSANVSVAGNLAFNVNQGGSGGTFTLGSGVSATSTGTTAITGNAIGTSAMTFTGPAATTVTMTGAYAGSVAGSMVVDSFSNIQAITASGHADDNIIGPAGGQTFNILDDASGGSITGILTSFTSFTNVTGGTGNDSFVFADSGPLSGIQTIYIEGGSGSNTLDVSYFQPDSSYFYRSVQMWVDDVNEGSCLLMKNLLWSDNTTTTVWFTNIGNIEGAHVRTIFCVWDDGALSGQFRGHTNNGSTDYREANLPYTELDYEFIYEEVTLDLTNNSITRINGGQANGFSNVQYFYGNYYGPKGYVLLPNDPVAVYLVDRDGLTVQRAAEFYRIHSFDKYYGGNGNDTFRFTEDSLNEVFPSFSETLLLDGGGGINAFDFRSLTSLPNYYFDRGSGYIRTTNQNGEIITIDFANINYFYLPGVFLTWFGSRIDIITMPESSIISSAEDKGISLGQKTVLPTAADIRFIINNSLTPGEIGGTAIPLTFNSPAEKASQLFASFIGEKYFAAKILDPLFKVRLAKLSDIELELVAKNCQFAPVPEIKL